VVQRDSHRSMQNDFYERVSQNQKERNSFQQRDSVHSSDAALFSPGGDTRVQYEYVNVQENMFLKMDKEKKRSVHDETPLSSQRRSVDANGLTKFADYQAQAQMRGTY